MAEGTGNSGNAAAAAAKAKPKKKRVLRIRSSKEGFWRAKVQHSLNAVDHPIDRFTREQIAQLKAEPILHVEEVEVPDEAGAADES